MSKEPIRVIIADDHAMVRSGLRLFLMAFDDLKMVGEASSGQAVLALCAQEKADVIVMDMIMPGMDGIRTTQEIHSKFPKIQVIGMTSFQDANLIQEMLDAGAISFLMKNVSAAELAVAIRDAAEGKATVSAEVREILKVSTISPAQGIGFETYKLSERERQVLTCMVSGCSNAEIAGELVISLSTVKYHVSRILEKLGVGNRSEAVSLALQHRLVTPSTLNKK
jgi:two-component system, NarL family, response regulator LiaR